MAISPMYVGQTGPVMQASIKTDDGSAAAIGGATFLLTIHNNRTEVDRTGAGVWTIYDSIGGVVYYAWDATDTATIGSYSLGISYMIAGITYVCDPVDWQIIAR